MTTKHTLTGTDQNGRQVNVAFGSGGSAVQAHKAAADAKQKRADRKSAAQDRKRGR